MQPPVSKRVALFAVMAGLIALAVWFWGGSDAAPAGSDRGAEDARGDSPAAPPGRAPLPAFSVTPRYATDARATATGRVTDDGGTPILGATVCATIKSAQAPTSHSRSPTCTQTGPDGTYRLDGLYALLHRFDASAPRHLPADYRPSERAGLVVLAPGATASGVDFVLHRGGTRVRGVVRDISGGAIEAAILRATPSDLFGKGGTAVTTSDAEGRFELWVREGRASVHATADGYAEQSKSGSAPGPDFELYLSPEAVVVGSVRRADTGEPVAGIEVELMRSGMFTTLAASALTDAEGRFRIDGLQPGVLSPRARSAALFGRADSIAVGLTQTSDPVVIEVHPSLAVQGRVVIEQTGEPCMEGIVHLRSDEGESLDAPVAGDGSVLFAPISPGRYAVSPRCYFYRTAEHYDPVVVEAGSVQGLTWTVSRGATVRGSLVDAKGDAVGGQMVVARAIAGPAAKGPGAIGMTSFSLPSAPDGSFRIHGLAAGTHTVTTPDGFGGPATEGVEVEVEEGGTVEGVVLHVRETAEVRGTVQDAQGDPVVAARVRARPDKGRGTDVFTDATGAFVLPRLPPGGGNLRVNEGRFDSELRAPGADPSAPTGHRYDAPAGEVTEVALVVEPVDGTIEGSVVDSEGAPVGDAFVDLIRQSERPGSAARNLGRLNAAWGHQPTLTDLSGEFRIAGVPDGKYTVQAMRKGGGAGFASDVAVGSRIVLEVLDPSRISGTVALDDGSVPERFKVKLTELDSYVTSTESYYRGEGRWSMGGLRPGSYRINATAADGTAIAEVEVAAGEERDEVALVLAPRITVVGRIVDLQSGEPVKDRVVQVVPRGSGVSFGGATTEDKKEITGAEGRFEVSSAPTGEVSVSVTAAGSRVVTNYPFLLFIPRSIDASEGARFDVGDIALPKRRIEGRERAGDLGYTLRDADREVPQEEREHVIAEVREGGPAAERGLRAGDVITAIDGHDIRGPRGYLYDALHKVPEGTTIELSLARGGSVTIVAGPPT